MANDYGALPVDSKTGLVSASADVAAVNTLGAFGQTMLAAVGVDASTIASLISVGTPITGALA